MGCLGTEVDGMRRCSLIENSNFRGLRVGDWGGHAENSGEDPGRQGRKECDGQTVLTVQQEALTWSLRAWLFWVKIMKRQEGLFTWQFWQIFFSLAFG